MKVALLGVDYDGIRLMREIKESIPAQCIAVSSDTAILENCGEETIRYSKRLPLEAAVSRSISKINKRIRGADLVFLLSSIYGKKEEHAISYIVKSMEGPPAVCAVWYPAVQRGKKRLKSTLEWLEDYSSVVAVPFSDSVVLKKHLIQMICTVLHMCTLPYANTNTDVGKRMLREGGRIHIARTEIPLEDLSVRELRLSPEMDSIKYSPVLDTLLEYAESALLHVIIPEHIGYEKIRSLVESVFFCLGEGGDFNIAVTVKQQLTDSVGIELLANHTATFQDTVVMW